MRRALSATALFVCACGGGSSAPPADMTLIASLLPDDYATTYTQTRPCIMSTDHDLNNVTVLADANAVGPYTTRMAPFPAGAVVVKPQYDIDDTKCEGPIIQWTVMQKLADGSSPMTNDWTWQRIFSDKKVETQNDQKCITCHADCGTDPYGYAGTCSAPLP